MTQIKRVFADFFSGLIPVYPFHPHDPHVILLKGIRDWRLEYPTRRWNYPKRAVP